MTHPNHFRYEHNNVLVGLPLGEVLDVRPNGRGGMSVWLRYGTRLDFTRTDLRRICRDGSTQLAEVNGHLDEVHDAVGTDE
jgi:hypothetical protein